MKSERRAKREGGGLGQAWVAQLSTQQKYRGWQKHFKNTIAIFFLLEPVTLTDYLNRLLLKKQTNKPTLFYL